VPGPRTIVSCASVRPASVYERRRRRDATLDFVIREAPVALEQVVVTATGDVRRKEITNSMATISAEQIQNAPVANAQQLLSAQTPGVTVLANSGQPGAGGQIRLRGNNSISQDNNPIIYVDGVRIYSGVSPTVTNARQTINPFNDIRSEDIERVEVVKGAAATTLTAPRRRAGDPDLHQARACRQAAVVARPHRRDQRPGLPQGRWRPHGGLSQGLSGAGVVRPRYRPDERDVRAGREVRGRHLPVARQVDSHGAVQKAAMSVAGGSDIAQYFLPATSQ
jgi:hypothetical protein